MKLENVLLYRNPREKFGLRFNFIAGIYNFEIKNLTQRRRAGETQRNNH
jgi:hypothetical protein